MGRTKPLKRHIQPKSYLKIAKSMISNIGRFITFEGGEGAGKSTQVNLLCKRLAHFGIKTLATREPGGSQGAEEIREVLVNGNTNKFLPLTEALLHNAARHEHIQRTILPAINNGIWVICDRFSDSTFAYQGFGLSLKKSALEALNLLSVGTMKPDLTFIIDIPVSQGLGRANNREDNTSRYEKMDLLFHERLRQGFLSIAAGESSRCKVVNGSLDLETVENTVWRLLQDKFGNEIVKLKDT